MISGLLPLVLPFDQSALFPTLQHQCSASLHPTNLNLVLRFN